VADSPKNPAPMVMRAPNFGPRFAFVYGALGAVMVAAIVGLVVVARQPSPPKPPAWSSWKPKSGSVAAMTNEIAEHVAQEYKLNKGGDQLVAIIPSAPEVTKNTKVASVSTIGIRVSSTNQNYSRIIPTTGNVQDQFCGLGSVCSINRGTPTAEREQLIRREALEVALYTFKYVHGVNALIGYMPPAPGQMPTTVLYLEKSNLSQQLGEPLAKTLPLTTPPLPTASDPRESSTIDKLTLPAEYTFGYAPLTNGTEALILIPTS
jgi:hypothetical protein